MAFFDFPIEELRVYKPERDEPANFDFSGQKLCIRFVLIP